MPQYYKPKGYRYRKTGKSWDYKSTLYPKDTYRPMDKRHYAELNREIKKKNSKMTKLNYGKRPAQKKRPKRVKVSAHTRKYPRR